jgi:integrase
LVVEGKVGQQKFRQRHSALLVRLGGADVNHLARQCEGKSRADLLFPGPAGDYLRRPRARSGWWDKAVRVAGLPRLTPRELRHTAASLAVSAGANVKAVQRMLGHASAAMTLDVYSDLFDDDLEAVAVARSTRPAGRLWPIRGHRRPSTTRSRVAVRR